MIYLVKYENGTGCKVPDGILKYCLEKLEGSDLVESYREREIYWCNLGIRKNTFVRRLGTMPKRPGTGGIVQMDYAFTAVV